MNESYNFPIGTAIHEDLNFVFRCRNSVMHAKSEVLGEQEIFHKGNHEIFDELKHERILRIANLPIELLKNLGQHDQRNTEIMKHAGLIYRGIAHDLALHEFKNV